MLEISSPKDAALVISNALQSHKEIYDRFHNIEDYLLRGKKPFSEEDLIEAGFGWCANFNYGKGRSKIEKVILENAADLVTSLAFANIEFRTFNEKKDKKKVYSFLQDVFLKEQFADAIVGAFIDTLEFDNDAYSWILKIEYNSFVFGWCAVTRDYFSYLGHANHVRSIAFEDRTKLQNINNWILFDVVKADFLYRTINEIKKFEPVENSSFQEYENGWVKDGLEEIFKVAFNDRELVEIDGKFEIRKRTDEKSPGILINTWENIELVISKMGLSFVLNNVNNVYIAKIYYFDKDNKFIELYLAVNGDYETKGIDQLSNYKYLLYYKNHGKKDKIEVFNLIRDYSLNSNDYIHELRGAGKLVAEDSLRYDIKKCRLEDKLLINGAPTLEVSNTFQQENIKLAMVGGFMVPAEGVAIKASEAKLDLSSYVQSIQFDEQGFNRESQHLDPSITGRLSSRPTKDEVQQQSREVTTQKLSKVPVKLADYATLFKNVLLDLATKEFITDEYKQKYFFNKLKEALASFDLPDKDIKDIISCIQRLKLSQVNTNLAALEKAMQIANSSKARTRLQIQYLVALGFSRSDARSYVEVEDYGNQVSMAALENVAFYTSSEIAFDVGQDHITHLHTHFAKLDRVTKGIQAGEDIVEGFHFMVNCLVNTEQHVAAIEQNHFLRSQYKQFKQIQDYFETKVKQIAQLIQKMKAQAQQQAQEGQQNGQQQPQIDAKTQATIYNDRIKMMDKIKRTNTLQQQASQRKMEAFELQKQIKQQESQEKINNDKQFAELKKQLELLKKSVELSAPQPQPQPSSNGNTREPVAA